MKHLIFLLVILAPSAQAYHIDDHKAIMHQAFVELADCFQNASTLLDLEWLSSGDVDEDTDLLEKWTTYSHYYNPYKKLNMIREDSSGRIDDLAPEFRHTGFISTNEMSDLGHAIHHFQDMTVPSHVVPVSHWLFDGFETYDFSGDISSGWTCEDLVAMQQSDMLTILRETAIQTLTNISNSKLTFVSTVGDVKNTVQTDATAFWQESDNDDFGEYGYLGNNFGQTQFSAGDIGYQVSNDYYASFKQTQMKLAVQASLRGLLWELGPDFAASMPSSRLICRNYVSPNAKDAEIARVAAPFSEVVE